MHIHEYKYIHTHVYIPPEDIAIMAAEEEGFTLPDLMDDGFPLNLQWIREGGREGGRESKG
jgi:hypothetical protein